MANCSIGVEVTPSPCSSELEWYNATSCVCQIFPVEKLDLFDPAGIVFLVIAIFSALLNLFVCIVFIQFRYTPIVKAANRELSFLLLFVLMISFSFPIIRIGSVEMWRCQARAWIEGPVSTCVYAIFLVKTHRVLSIFEARLPKVVHRQWILGRNFQLVGVFLITLVQVIIVAVFVNVFSQSVEYIANPELMITHVRCKSEASADIIISVYPILITILCLCFTFRARRLPENYGESRHIFAIMAVNLSVYFTCFGLEFMYQGSSQIIIGNVFLSVSPLGELVLLFIPKVYIILICPERNTVQELRKMTLAHMQRQSEFSPDTNDAVRGEGSKRKKNGEDQSRLKSLRKSKQNGVPTTAVGPRNVHNPVQNGQIIQSAHSVENGKRPSLCERGHLGNGVTTGEIMVGSNTYKGNEENGDRKLSYKKRPKHSLRRESSGLFVIQILDDIKEDVSGTVADRPLNFSLRKTEDEHEGEGDMFVVSMLGRTLTLTSDDRNMGVPEILGGVYVGSKVSCKGGTHNKKGPVEYPTSSLSPVDKPTPTGGTDMKDHSKDRLRQDDRDDETDLEGYTHIVMAHIGENEVVDSAHVHIETMVDKNEATGKGVFQDINDVSPDPNLGINGTTNDCSSVECTDSDPNLICDGTHGMVNPDYRAAQEYCFPVENK